MLRDGKEFHSRGHGKLVPWEPVSLKTKKVPKSGGPGEIPVSFLESETPP